MILTTCKHFDLVGNRCSRVTGGKCDDLPDCEFKYIEALKAENERLRFCLDTQRIDETNQYIEKVNIERKNYKLKQTLKKIKRILCEGRTFYDGYFDNPESLSRIDKAIYLITKAESEEQ